MDFLDAVPGWVIALVVAVIVVGTVVGVFLAEVRRKRDEGDNET